jgi:hypothetical protein
MTDEDKIKLISYLRRQMSESEKERFEKEDLSKPELKEQLKIYEKMINQIDLLYVRKKIAEEIADLHFTEEEEGAAKIKKMKSKEMKTKGPQWIQYVIMLFISLIVSFIVFSIFGRSDEATEKEAEKESNVKIQQTDSTVTDNKIKMDDDNKGIEIMGIALNKTGFYVLPYSVVELNAVFGSNNSMSNNLPLTVIWDDKELGLAVAAFADENLTKLPNIPYSFSRDDYFLGEDLFFICSTKSEIRINRGIVIRDNPSALSMTVQLALDNEVYGAIVLDNSGEIVGICEKNNKDGQVKVIKSIALNKMVQEMNLDKGVSYIALPTQNYLRSKSNPQRIESFAPFVAWFNTK